MIIRNADVQGRLCDVRLVHDAIVELGTDLKGADGIDAGGCALLPGLHDHHIHLNASAAALNSVRCGPPFVTNEAELIKALHQPGEGDLRGIGYHHSVAGDIDRAWLDQYGPHRPVRIQHRGGRMWVLNSLAMQAFGLSSSDNGRLVDGDHLLPTPSAFPDLTALIRLLLSYGITGVTEVTPRNGVSELSHYMQQAKPLRLCVMGREELSGIDDPIIGPLKLHYHEYNLPGLEDLAAQVKRAHDNGRAVAAHCVTRAELMLTLAAIEMAGVHPGDRIEHAAIADDAAIEWMSKLGVIVVSQPNFIAERAQAYLEDVESHDHKNLWRLAAFKRAGLRLAAGSDAPFGDSNPWAAMASSCKRPDGFGSDEVLTPEEALALYTKPAQDAGAAPRCIEVGQAADLCLIDRSWRQAREDLRAVNVCAVWIDGHIVYDETASIKPHSSAV